MIKTMIVEDDFLARSYLKQLNAWHRAGYQIAADVRDGEEALAAMEGLEPEVLITDISMPLMNGIELIRRVRETNRAVYIIVLSCHDDFEYVKEAMRLGADEYVLKNSLNEDSLYELLLHTSRQLEEKQAKLKKSDEAKRLAEMGRHSLKYHFFKGLLSGRFTSEQREEKRLEAGIRASYTNSAAILLFIPLWEELKHRHAEIDLQQYSQSLLQRLKSEIQREHRRRGDAAESAELLYLGEGRLCCFLDMSDLHRSSLMRQRLSAAAAACLRCSREEEYEIRIGVSAICFGAEGIRQAYDQAQSMVKLSFYEDGILYYEESPQIGNTLPKEAEELLEHASDFVRRRSYDELEREIQKACGLFRQQHTDPDLVLRWLRSMESRLNLEKTPSQITKADQLVALCEACKKQLSADRQKPLPAHVSAAVRCAADYLQAHYKEPIGLADAAKAAGLNPAYLSYLFKQELGIGFSAYLLELRMECAKALLLDTNDKIKDIACQAGFNDYHYFSKAFKKINGCSPLTYRRNQGESRPI